MMHRRLVLAILFAFCSLAAAQTLQLTPIEPETLQRVSARLAEEVDKIEGLQLKFAADVSKAVGLYRENVGIVAIPVKGLSEDNAELMQAAKGEKGVGVAYLFFSKQFSPVVDGKRVAAEKLRIVKITTAQGETRDVGLLILSARQVTEDEWRLYAYGTDAKPLAQPQIADAPAPKPAPLSIEVTGVEGTQGDLVITLLGKYSSKIRMDYQAG